MLSCFLIALLVSNLLCSGSQGQTVSKAQTSSRSTPKSSGQKTVIILDTLPIPSEEVHDPKYVVSVARHPDEAQEGGHGAASSQKLVKMRDASGREFHCRLPSSSEHGDHQEEEPKRDELTPSTLLEGLNGQCIYHVEEWWKYELCFQKQVRQYHEEGGQILNEYSLGRWDDNSSSLDTVHTEEATLHPSNEYKYVSERYVGGDACDITGELRQTEVRYMCTEDIPATLAAVKEASTCQYLVIVRTPDLCKHPDFKAKQVPVREIACYPLNDDLPESEPTEPAEPEEILADDRQDEVLVTGRFSNGQSIEIGGLTINTEAMLDELVRMLGSAANSEDPDRIFFEGLDEEELDEHEPDENESED